MTVNTAGEPIEDLAMRPYVSIVTVNFNMAEELACTIASVAAQDFPSREYVIVDGGSSDASQAVLRDHAANITRWVSEPDCGIYDAMNKGIAMARGRWILFLNSGDALASSDVLSRVFLGEEPDDEILYGDALIHYGGGAVRLAAAAAVEELPFGMICSHQAVFARRTILASAPFKVGKIRSDYEFMLNSWKAGRRFRDVNVLVAKVEAGGLSDRKRIPALCERAALLREADLLSSAVAVNLGLAFFGALMTPPAKALLPERVINLLRKLKISLLGARSARG